LGAITRDVGRHDALLFENRTWHAGGLNVSGELRIAVIYQYGYRWLAQVDDPVDVWPEATAIERQLLGAPDRADHGTPARVPAPRRWRRSPTGTSS
jgi:ectoine hydroxylase-related dioxygenase (phytanoyl-CoA dioxygenase family)